MTLPLTLIIANNNKNNSNDANIKNNVCKNDTTDHRTDKRLFRKVSPRIQHLQTRLLGAVHVQCDSGARSLQSLNSAGANNDAARDINTDGGAWNCRTSRVSSSSEHSLLVRVTKNGPSCHPISLTARQLVQPDAKKPLAVTVSSSSASDSTTSSQQQQQRRPRTRLERARVLTKHTERPDMFVRQDDQGEGLFERTLNDHRRFAESVSVSRPLSLSRTSLTSPSRVVSDGARVICDPSHRHRSATERLSSVIERVKHSHQHSNHSMMPTCVSNCSMLNGCKNGANCYHSSHPHGKVSTSTRQTGVADKNGCCGHRCCCCCCCTDTDQHSGHQRHFGARGCHNYIGSQCGNTGTRGEHRCRAESIDRGRSRTGHRSSMSSEDVASRRSKSVVRFFDSECVDGGVSSAVRRSRSIEHLAGAPPRGALRTSSSTSSSWCSSGQHVVKPLLVEVDGCVLVNTSQEESGFESDEPLRCLPADLHERFFYCRDGYYSDKQRHRPAISAGFYYARAPAKKSGVGGVSSSRRQFRKRYAVDRNNNNVGNSGSGSSSAGGRHKHHHAPSVHPINGRYLSKTSLAVAPGAIIMPASRDHRCPSGRAGHVHRLSAGLHRMFIGGRKSGDSVGGHVDCVDYRRCWDSSAALNHRAVFARAGSRSSRVRFTSKHQLVNRNTPSSLQTTATSSPRSRQQAGSMTGHNVTRPGQQHGVDARAPCSSPAAVVADLVSVMDENVMNNKRTTVTDEDVALRHHDDNDDERHHHAHHHAHESGSSRDGLVTAGGGGVDEPVTADSERHSENESKSCLSSTQTTLADESRPQEQEQATISSPQQGETSLPPGWEKHEDADGAYYWHIRSGTIQRHVPASNLPQCGENGVRLRQHRDSESSSGVSSGSSASSGLTRSCTSSAVNDLAVRRCSHQRNGDKRKSFPSAAFGGATTEATVSGGGRVRFAVRCLGSQEIDERQLTAELSSRTVNKCIVDLALGRGHVANDGIGHWGEGKDLFMDFEDGCVKLREPDSLTVVHSQPIHTIRVWGVGRDNARDFAYVARDRTTRRHVCHVFRCESPARLLSNTLRDMCKKIMIERSLSQSVATRLSETGCGDGVRRNRPTSLILDQRKLVRAPPQTSLTFAGSQNHAFPTPIDEPCRVIRARYMGAVTVKRPSGIDTLNGALDTMVARVTNTGDTSRPSHELWPSVDVCVAPSTITVRRAAETDAQDGCDSDSRGECVLECRVRFLSFLGIGRAVEHCGIVVHTAQDVFVAHGFHCEESAGPLCKTIEAACNLRYQKCLDALPGVMADGGGNSAAQSQIMQHPGGGGAGTAHRSGGRLSHTLRFMLDSLKLPSMVGGDKQRHTASSK